jgi:hypothetical protein
MKVEMFPNEVFKGYLIDKRIINVKLKYENGEIDINVKYYQTIEGLKRKFCKKYCLEKDLILTDEEKRVIGSQRMIQNYDR